MNLPTKRSLGVVLFCGFLIVFVVYLVNNLEEFRLLTQVSLWPLLMVAGGHAASIGMNAVFLVVILRPFERTLSMRESSYINLMSAIGNYFTPFRGGIGIRAVYLKRRHRLKYSTFVSTLAGTYVIAFSVSALVGIAAVLAIRGAAPSGTLLWIASFFFAVLAGAAAIMLIGVPRRLAEATHSRPLVGRLIETAAEVGRGWNTIASDQRLVTRLTAITFLNLLLIIAITHAAAAALGIETRFWGVVLYSVLTSLAVLVAITPGGVGIRESVAILSSTAIGFTTPEILSIAVVDRVALFVVLGLGWLVSPLLFRPGRRLFGGASEPGDLGASDQTNPAAQAPPHPKGTPE